MEREPAAGSPASVMEREPVPTVMREVCTVWKSTAAEGTGTEEGSLLLLLYSVI